MVRGIGWGKTIRQHDMLGPAFAFCRLDSVLFLARQRQGCTSWYHFHASGLMGSPTVPRIRKDFREDFFTKSSPKDCSALMAVGAVYSSVTCAQEFLYQQP